MMVILENAFDDNGNPTTVTRIRYEDNIEGPIRDFSQSADGRVKTLTVMGQTVLLQDGVTTFDNNDPGFDDFSDIGSANIDNLVEVSGYMDFDGSIRATYIERKALAATPGDLFEVKGVVSNLDTASATFDVNGLTVDFSGVVPRNGTLSDGRLVEVKGDTLVGDTLQAKDVEIVTGGLNVEDAVKVSLEGYLSNLDAAAGTFEINGQKVDYAGAVFIGGSDAELADGVKIEAEGPVSNGVLTATKVVFKDSIKIEANLAEIDATAGSLTLQGLTGISVQSDGLTIFDGFSGLDDLTAGNHLKIRGRRTPSTGSTIIASQIERIDTAPDDRTLIQGPVDGFVAFSSVDILEVSVDTTSIANDDFKDHDTIIGEAEFFSRLSIGVLVKARFDLDTGTWDQIEFED